MSIRWQCEQCGRVRILPEQPNLETLRCVRCGCRTGEFLNESEQPAGVVPPSAATAAGTESHMAKATAPEPAPAITPPSARVYRCAVCEIPEPEVALLWQVEQKRFICSSCELADAARAPAEDDKQAQASRLRKSCNWGAYVGLAVGLALAVGAIYLILPHMGSAPSWEQQNTPVIERLLAEAEADDREGRTQQAYERYEVLFNHIEGRSFTNRELVARLNVAAKARRRLGEEIARSRPPTELVRRPAPPLEPPPAPNPPPEATPQPDADTLELEDDPNYTPGRRSIFN